MEILRLMGACNNRCRFCMVHDEMEKSYHKPLSEFKSIIENIEESERIDLFGGEPTMYPYFWELIQLAADKNIRISIATNGRAMSSKKFVNRLTQYQHISIRTSLYGFTDEAHDYYTRVKGSFSETLLGIKNLCKSGNAPLVNIVMLEKNCENLEEMVGLLAGIGVKTIKFSSVYGRDDISDFLIDYKIVKPSLNRTLFAALKKDIAVQVEKSPYCLVPDFINDFLPENDPIMIRQVEVLYLYAENCRECKLKRACSGVLRSYYKKFAESGLATFNSIPSNAVRNVPFSQLQQFKPQCESDFISINYSDQDLKVENIFKSIKDINYLKMQYPQVFIVKDGGVSI